jgi:competence protein ComEA
MKKIIFTLIAFLGLSFSAIAAVNINTATEAELETLNGIGPAKAKAIVEYRKKQGGFKSIDELENVEGIGSKTLNNLRKDLSLTGKTTAAVDTKAVGNAKAAASGNTATKKTAQPAAKEPTKK